MGLTSVIIPARNDRLLESTLRSIYANAGADIEAIVILDGPTNYPIEDDYSNLLVIYNEEAEGIRKALNRAVAICNGDHILKVDAHCLFGENFVSTLAGDCEDNWVVVARRYTLDIDSMGRAPRIVDYYYLSCPWTHPRGTMMMQSCPWITKTEDRMNTPIDDLMCFQGSMWFMSRNHWTGLRTDLTYAEHHEISMSTWFSGGRVVINKNTWYAHPAVRVSGYKMNMDVVYSDHDASARYWTNQVGFEWLIDKFWPLPTENNHHRIEKYLWPEDWKKHYGMAY